MFCGARVWLFNDTLSSPSNAGSGCRCRALLGQAAQARVIDGDDGAALGPLRPGEAIHARPERDQGQGSLVVVVKAQAQIVAVFIAADRVRATVRIVRERPG